LMTILPSDYDVLFEQHAVADTIAHQLEKINFMINEPSDDALLSTPTEDIVEHAYRNFMIEPVVINRTGVSRNPTQLGSYRDDDGQRRSLENAFKFEVAFPFSGALGMFNHHIGEPPPRKLRAKRVDHDGGGGVLLIAVHGEDLTKEAVKEEVEREINDIIPYMDRINEQVAQFNGSIRDRVRAAANKRKDQILAARDVAASLGYKMQRRPDAPPTYITQELQRVIRPGLFIKVREDVRFEPEPTIDEEEYKHILDVMSGMALMMERSPRTFTKLKEEEIRDHFLLQLNGHYKGNALGETFNRKGKTDILVREQDKNLFIGECKIWKDANGITAALDQLLSYLTWRDTKAALVVFVKRKSIDRPLATIMKTVEEHECMKRAEWKSVGRQRFVFGKREDPSREIILAVLVFHIPPLEGIADDASLN
jgi:hypothetical protein